MNHIICFQFLVLRIEANTKMYNMILVNSTFQVI